MSKGDAMAGKRFELTPEHVTLLTRAYIGWEDCEYGAPAIDCKRPYGNSSVEIDVCELLGWPYDEDEGPTQETRERVEAIHRETQTALQVILRTQSFEPGSFTTSSSYDVAWRRVSS